MFLRLHRDVECAGRVLDKTLGLCGMWAHGETGTGAAVLACDWKMEKLNAKCFEPCTWPGHEDGQTASGTTARQYGFRIYSEDAAGAKKRRSDAHFKAVAVVERLRSTRDHVLYALADGEPAITAYKFQ